MAPEPQTLDPLQPIADAITARVLETLTPRLLDKLSERTAPAKPDPLLSVAQAAKHTGISGHNIRMLIKQGLIHQAPGLLEIKIRQSALDAYGVANPRK